MFVNMGDNDFEKIKRPWPTKDAMEQIYEKNLWGGDSSVFYSGIGSHNPEIINPYIAVLQSFLKSFEHPITVCDLGCGDFNVGKELVKHTRKYDAVDIVSNLIIYNKGKFKDENLKFHCLDIAVDDLPHGDCAILRQVLQHVSNTEIQCILTKLNQFKYVIITEHLPQGNNFIPNKDIVSGQGIRLKKQSGVNILAVPFNFKVKQEKQLLSLNLKDGTGVIETTLYKIF
ncbi:class I SAM-dependent methyltransferase [Maribacter sp. CXY002]|uniref:class I SAM-dependent methyltransferase n=1 Tax=Maribacter luteocoastalis TaxID=3407671 RepID=UPI003B68498A